MNRAVIAAVVAAGALAGCSGDSGGGSVPPTPQASVTPETTATVTPARRYPGVGDNVVREEGAFAVKLLDFRDRVELDTRPERGSHWAAARVRFCWRRPVSDDTGEPVRNIGVTWSFWSVVGSDTGRTTAGSQRGLSTPRWKTPIYPRSVADATLTPGTCLSGWIEFPVQDGQRIAYVRYAPRQGGPTMWAV